MEKRRNAVTTFILGMSLALAGCGTGQIFGPTVTPAPTLPPTPTVAPTPKPVKVDTLTAAALKADDIPRGFSPVTGNDLQGMQELQSIVTTDFPDASVYGLTVYGKKLDSGQYDAVVISFYFYPLSAQDITRFDDPTRALKNFSHGAGMAECIDCGNGKYIGDYSANLSLSTASFNVDEVVGRRANVGFATMVLSGGQPDRLDLAATVAKALVAHIQQILGQ